MSSESKAEQGKIENLQKRIIELENLVKQYKDSTQTIQKFRRYAECIIETIHEPFLILSKNIKIISANSFFIKLLILFPLRLLGLYCMTPPQGNGISCH
ncbi:MAG: hypothetical protein ABH836_00870 [Candidatus Omnitrophota bacterium]